MVQPNILKGPGAECMTKVIGRKHIVQPVGFDDYSLACFKRMDIMQCAGAMEVTKFMPSTLSFNG